MTERLFDDETLSKLQSWGFDLDTFRNHTQKLRAGTAGAAANRISGPVDVPPGEAIVRLEDLAPGVREELAAKGRDAIRRGAVGVLVLAGGMATRFGGVVKALVPAIDGVNFLELKRRDAERAAQEAGGSVPFMAMTSFATDGAIRTANRTAHGDDGIVFPQFVSVRLTPEGDVFLDADGAPSRYAPGHGDLTFALRKSGVLERFRDAGGEVLVMSNVDNLLATLDETVLGAHLDAGAAITVECVDKDPGDRGGSPALVDGRVQIVEAFRFPETFDQDAIGVFNTNTLILDANAIDRDFDLSWFAVEKEVDGRKAIQFEHLVGELTAFSPTQYIAVPRSGPGARFAPVKDPAELERRRPEIRRELEARGVLAVTGAP
ncbi:MAG: UTP--glucose-1-phosphate uridylyltransferase [Deltaproteobacteria bacterium]|nr:UTP--glucose-1-phosphate uridylyltransferase [Deltaproteobacteria bacterium]